MDAPVRFQFIQAIRLNGVVNHCWFNSFLEDIFASRQLTTDTED